MVKPRTPRRSAENRPGAGTALVVIDMLNPYEHEDAELLIPNVEPVVNDNYGDWNSSAEELAERALAHIDDNLGATAIEMMRRNMRAEIVGCDELRR